MSGQQHDRRYSPAWRTGTKVVFPPLIKAVMKRDWQGFQHFPRQGGMLVAANHLSYADWVAMCLFVHQAGRYPAFMIKASAFDVKGIGTLLRGCGQLPVRRGEADAANVLKAAEQALAAGECVVIYPEGTASRDPEQWPMIAKTGVARLALASGVPVIPVACWGAQDILPYGTTKPHLWPRHTVKMLAGPPVDLTEFEGKPFTADVLRGATNAIMADVATLLAELRGGQPPAEPYHPAIARRAARQAARAQQDAAQQDAAQQDAAQQDGAQQDGAQQDGAQQDRGREDGAPADSAEQDGAPQAAAAGPGGLPEPGPDAEPREATPT